MNIGEHMERFLGPIEHGWSAHSGLAGVQVCRFQDQPSPSASTYATLGLSSHVLSLKGSREVRQELLLAMHQHQASEAHAGLLLEAASRLLKEHKALLRGEVLHLEGAVLPGTEATALYASLPVLFPEGLATYTGTTPATVFVWLFPILPGEVRYITAHGWSAFEDLLEQKDPDLLDARRAPVV